MSYQVYQSSYSKSTCSIQRPSCHNESFTRAKQHIIKSKKPVYKDDENDDPTPSDSQSDGEEQDFSEERRKSRLDISIKREKQIKVLHLKPLLSRENNGQNWFLNILIGATILFIAASVIYCHKNNTDRSTVFSGKEEPEYMSAIEKLRTRINAVKEVFINQDNDLWKKVLAGVMQTFQEPERPSIFLLLANNKQPMECLAQTIADMSRQVLGSNTILVLHPESLGKDYGIAVNNLKPRVETSKAVVIFELLNIHVEALKAFHNFCDRIEPLVKKAVFVITMTTDKDLQAGGSAESFVEKLLYNKLNGKIDQDMIPPLITRISDGAIFFVKPEIISSCPVDPSSFSTL